MSAERLRRAAMVLRKTAEQATLGPWRLDAQEGGYMDVLQAEDNPDDKGQFVASADDWNAPHIAVMHPGVSMALAEWMDWMGDRSASGNEHPAMRGLGLERALAVADAVLGEP